MPVTELDLQHCNLLQSREDELAARHNQLDGTVEVGHDLIKAENFGADKIQERITEINDQWSNLMDLSAYRKKRLLEAVDFYQVCFCRHGSFV